MKEPRWRTSNSDGLDPITGEVIRNAMVAIAQEMNNTIVRTAFNPLLFDTKDFGIAVLSGDGELWAEDSGLSVFIGCMPGTIKTGLAKIGPSGYGAGDVLIVNDPYLTGTHISDTTVYMPVIHEGRLLAFAAVTAHWADVGGRTPGGWDMTSSELFQEGVCFTHQWLVRGDEPVRDMFDLISANVRFPDIVRGDLDAQISACRTGVARIIAMCRRYGPDVVQASMDHVIQATARAMAERISALPDGTYSRSVTMDYDGLDRAIRPKVVVNLTIREDRIKASFDGTSSAARSSMNVPGIGTASQIFAVVKGLLAPVEATNAGHFANIDVDLPPNSLINPARPAGADSYGLVGVAVNELAQLALAPLFPDTSRAGSYQLFGIYLLRTDPRYGRPFIMIDPIDGGHGAHSQGDGSTLIFSGDGDTLNLPVEVMENRYPLRCLQFGFADGSPGEGAHRGGRGVVRDYQVLEPGTVLKYSNENTLNVLAQGVDGGTDGTASRIILRPGTAAVLVLTDRGNDGGELLPGDVVRTISGGGGGWGRP
jgi:N-methylhydantoinase B